MHVRTVRRTKAQHYFGKTKSRQSILCLLFVILGSPRDRLKENLCVSLSGEALAAVHSFAFGGLEGHLAFLTAISTNSAEHFSRASLCILSCVAAFFASLGFVFESLCCVEFLLTCGEHEIIATVFALQCLVLVHVFFLPHLIG